MLSIFMVVFLFGCSPQEPPIVNIPPQSDYEYKYLIVDNEECQPSAEELSKYIAVSDNIMDIWFREPPTDPYGKSTMQMAIGKMPERYKESIEDLRAVLKCVESNLDSELKKQTTENWEVMSVQPIDSGTYELDIDYSYIVILRRQK